MYATSWEQEIDEQQNSKSKKLLRQLHAKIYMYKFIHEQLVLRTKKGQPFMMFFNINLIQNQVYTVIAL